MFMNAAQKVGVDRSSSSCNRRRENHLLSTEVPYQLTTVWGETTSFDQSVYIHPTSVLFSQSPDWVIFTDILDTTTKPFMRNCNVVDFEWIAKLVPKVFFLVQILSVFFLLNIFFQSENVDMSRLIGRDIVMADERHSSTPPYSEFTPSPARSPSPPPSLSNLGEIVDKMDLSDDNENKNSFLEMIKNRGTPEEIFKTLKNINLENIYHVGFNDDILKAICDFAFTSV